MKEATSYRCTVIRSLVTVRNPVVSARDQQGENNEATLPRETVVVNVDPEGVAGGEQRVDAKIELVAVHQEGLQDTNDLHERKSRKREKRFEC